MDIQKQFEELYLSLGGKQSELEKENGEYTHSKSQMAWGIWQAAKASVAEGFVLVSAEQLNQWGHMANYAEQYGCSECFEARGYAHNLACEINAHFNVDVETQEPSHD